MPANVDYAGRSLDLLFMQGAQLGAGMHAILPGLDWDSGGKVTAGVQKAAQFFLLVFLTEKGSREQDTYFGTRFITEMRKANASDATIRIMFRDAAEDVLDQQNRYRALNAADDEVLVNAELVAFSTPDVSQLSMTVELTTLAGVTRKYIVPISLAIK